MRQRAQTGGGFLGMGGASMNGGLGSHFTIQY
jgi:hypothetical protein